MNTKLLLAESKDVFMLTAYSKFAFDSDVDVGAPALMGPPGYKSQQFYSKMCRCKYLYSFFDEDLIIGGAVLVPKAKENIVEICRIFIKPECFGKGYGMKMMELIEASFPDASGFILDTPIWNHRTNRFYQKCGYTEYKRDEEFVFYRKDREQKA